MSGKKLGIPFINLREFIVEPEVIRLLTAAIAFKHKVVPLYLYESKIVVAMESSMDWQVTDALSFNINKYVEPVMASPEDINWALQFYYSSEDIEQTIATFDETEMDPDADDSYDSTIFSAVETSQGTDNVVVRIVNKIIEDAHRQKVSDSHIEPGMGKQKVVVRFRKDGVIYILQIPNEIPGGLRLAHQGYGVPGYIQQVQTARWQNQFSPIRSNRC